MRAHVPSRQRALMKAVPAEVRNDSERVKVAIFGADNNSPPNKCVFFFFFDECTVGILCVVEMG
jgi:hypothetical protein